MSENDEELKHLRAENSALRALAAKHGCVYGHKLPSGVCQLGYPGCACADDLMIFEMDNGPSLAERFRHVNNALLALTKECMASDFNEHWDSFKAAEAVIKKYNLKPIKDQTTNETTT